MRIACCQIQVQLPAANNFELESTVLLAVEIFVVLLGNPVLNSNIFHLLLGFCLELWSCLCNVSLFIVPEFKLAYPKYSHFLSRETSVSSILKSPFFTAKQGKLGKFWEKTREENYSSYSLHWALSQCVAYPLLWLTAIGGLLFFLVDMDLFYYLSHVT